MRFSLMLAFIVVLSGCATNRFAPVNEDNELLVCGANTPKPIVFVIATYTKPPKGLAVTEVQQQSEHLQAINKYLADNFVSKFAEYRKWHGPARFCNEVGTCREADAWHYSHNSVPLPPFENYLTDEAKKAVYDLEHEPLLINVSDKAPFQFVLCRKSVCRGLKNPFDGESVDFDESSVAPYLPDVGHRGVVEHSPDSCVGCKSAFETFIIRQGFDFGNIYYSNYWAVPKMYRSELCRLGGLKDDCFEKLPIEKSCLDEDGRLTQVPATETPHSCWLKNAGLTTFESQDGAEKLPDRVAHESNLAFALLMKQAVKVTSQVKGDWTIRRFSFNPEKVCKYAKTKTHFVTD